MNAALAEIESMTADDPRHDPLLVALDGLTSEVRTGNARTESALNRLGAAQDQHDRRLQTLEMARATDEAARKLAMRILAAVSATGIFAGAIAAGGHAVGLW